MGEATSHGHEHEHAHGHGAGHGHGASRPGGIGMDPLVLLERANALAQRVIAAVPADGFAAQSPCEDWTVRDAVNHLVQGNVWAAANLRGDGQPVPRPQGDLTGDDPAHAFAESAADMMAAFREPGALGKMLHLPFGTMPGAAFAGMRGIDVLSHVWDVARGSGQPTADLDPELYAVALTAARQTMRFDRAGSPFKPETPISPNAAPSDQLAAFMGRTPEWLPAAEPEDAGWRTDEDDHDAPPAWLADQVRQQSEAAAPDRVAQLAEAVAVVAPIVAAVRPDQLDLPSPCTEWTVRQVIAHLVSGNEGLTAVLEEREPREIDLGDDPAAAFLESAERMLAALRVPGTLDRTLTLRFGPVPATMAVGFRFGDVLNHGWDVARATGQPTDFAPELNESALAMVRQTMASYDRTNSPAFRPETPAPAGASAADRLAAFLGRPAEWLDPAPGNAGA